MCVWIYIETDGCDEGLKTGVFKSMLVLETNMALNGADMPGRLGTYDYPNPTQGGPVCFQSHKLSIGIRMKNAT